MRSSNVISWVGLAAAILSLTAGCTLTALGRGKGCKTTPCTFFDKQNKAYDGVCGTKKSDDKNCYCVATIDKKKSYQEQSGCSLKADSN